jgi:predicted nucleic acid-binding protein
MKALVDTNVLLDVALQRAPFVAGSDGVVRWCEANPGHGFVAWHSVSNIYYMLNKQLGGAAARQFIAGMLGIFEVAETGTAAAKFALRLPLADFEDALQSVAAVAAGADVIVTRDKPDYTGSPIPARTPDEFLASFVP